MCSQFESVNSINKIAKATHAFVDSDVVNLTWQPHIYPHSQAPVVTSCHSHNHIRMMSYSLVPHWSKEAKPKFSTYNARLDRVGQDNKLEVIYNSPTWKLPFAKQRCLVPLSGFYESCKIGSHAGHIVKFAPGNSDEILLAAGIWDKWVNNESGEMIFSFAIITDNPCQFIQDVGHDRQPVFLDPEKAQFWMDYEKTPVKDAYDFLKQNQVPVDYTVENVRALKGAKQNDLFS